MRKAEFVKSMNTIVKEMNNEEAYYCWILIVPDEASEEDFLYIAEDEELFKSAVECFKEIVSEYLDDGFFIDSKLY